MLTSSCAAIFSDAVECVNTPHGRLTEDIWNTTSSEMHQPYSYSKTLAEQAAWKMAEEQDKWSLVVINPAGVIGPTVSGRLISAIHDIFSPLGDRNMKAVAPPLEVGLVDVADGNIRVAYIEKSKGRHIVFNAVQSPLRLANYLTEKYGVDYPLPRKELPKWLLWLIGPIVDRMFTRKMISLNMGHKWIADNTKSI